MTRNSNTITEHTEASTHDQTQSVREMSDFDRNVESRPVEIAQPLEKPNEVLRIMGE